MENYQVVMTIGQLADGEPTASNGQARHTNFRRTILMAVLFSLPAWLAAGSLVRSGSQNPDVWWHLSTGAWIVQHHHVPATDPFSAYGMSKPWVAYSWLFEVMIYGLYHWLGLVGPDVYVLAAVTVIGFVLYQTLRKRMAGFAAAVALAEVGLFVMAGHYTVRPWLFSILFFLIEMDILFAELVDTSRDYSARRLWFLPLLFVLWANLHIQFVYGLAVLALAALTQKAEAVRGAQGWRIAFAPNERRHRLWVVTGMSFLAALANPYTWRIYQVAFGLAGDSGSDTLVSEMMAPHFRSPLDYILIVVVLGAAYVLGRVQMRSRLFTSILLTGTTFVSLHSRRDEWVCLVVALLIIAAGCGKDLAADAPLPRHCGLAAAALAALFIFARAKQADMSNAHLDDLVSRAFPAKATEFVSKRGFPGPLFNDYTWGGYLIWRLPSLPVSMDGRSNIYGNAGVARSVATWNCKQGWKTDPELASSNLVIGPIGSPLSSALRDDREYQLVYEDKTAVVFVKRAN